MTNCITTHFQHSTAVSFQAPLVNKVLNYGAEVFPLMAPLWPKVGISMRAVIDLMGVVKAPLNLASSIRSGFSVFSAYAIFFAPASLYKIELVRSTLVHLRELYTAKNKERLFRAAVHFYIDALNWAVLIQPSRELKFFSYLLQLIVGIFDIQEQWDKGSKLGVGVQLCLSALRSRGCFTNGKEIYDQRQIRRQVASFERQTVKAIFGQQLKEIEIQHYNVTGNSISKMKDLLVDLRPIETNGHNGYTFCYIRYNWPDKEGKPDFSNIKATYQAKVYLPSWIPNLPVSDETVAKWRDYFFKLAEHEKGHVDIITKNLPEISKQIQRAALENPHLTADEAVAIGDKVIESMRAKHTEYDIDTDHGKKFGCQF